MVDRTPKYVAIADRLAESIRTHQIGIGDRLPAQRELAASLGVTIGTVTRAYAVLERRGLAVARVGDGTYVRYADQAPNDTATINLAYNVPVVVPDAVPALRAALKAIACDSPVLGQILDYQPELGMDRHRQAGALWLTRLGTTGDMRRVMLTHGAQHGLASVLRSFARRGEVLLTESLGYHGLQPIARQLGLQIIGVDTDREGLTPLALQQAIRTYGPRWLYCIPSLQMPTGTTMSPLRRQEIARILRNGDVLLIEDCVHSVLQEHPLPALSTWLPQHSFLLASLSKVTTPGLRVGYVEADPRWFGKLATAVRAESLMTAPLLAEVATYWLDSGRMAALLGAQRKVIAQRQALVDELLRRRMRSMPGSVTHHMEPGFPFVWLTLQGMRAPEAFESALRAAGVIVRMSSHFSMGRAVPVPGMRLSLSAPRDEDELLRGVEIVSRVLAGLHS